jgi:hypothetical protein
MHQVKIFRGLESDIASLEKQVNAWLAEAHVKVVNMFGNMSPQSPSPTSSAAISGSAFSPSDIFLVILYETT